MEIFGLEWSLQIAFWDEIRICVRYLSGGRSELPWQLNALTEIIAFSEPTSRLMRRVGCQWKYEHTLNSVCLTLELCLESNHSFCHCRLSMWVTRSSSLRIRVGLGCQIHCSGSCLGLFILTETPLHQTRYINFENREKLSFRSDSFLSNRNPPLFPIQFTPSTLISAESQLVRRNVNAPFLAHIHTTHTTLIISATHDTDATHTNMHQAVSLYWWSNAREGGSQTVSLHVSW